MNQQATIEIKRLGLTSYADCLQDMLDTHTAVQKGTQPNTLLVTEHRPCITLGKHAGAEDILVADPSIPQFRIDRGGKLTAHEPGQLVAYPVMRLASFEVRPFVDALNQSITTCLEEFGIDSWPEGAGVWTAKGKIASVGLRIKNGVSMHGLALNVTNSLATFKTIVPCGIQKATLCKISQFDPSIEFGQVQKTLESILLQKLGEIQSVKK